MPGRSGTCQAFHILHIILTLALSLSIVCLTVTILKSYNAPHGDDQPWWSPETRISSIPQLALLSVASVIAALSVVNLTSIISTVVKERRWSPSLPGRMSAALTSIVLVLSVATSLWNTADYVELAREPRRRRETIQSWTCAASREDWVWLGAPAEFAGICRRCASAEFGMLAVGFSSALSFGLVMWSRRVFDEQMGCAEVSSDLEVVDLRCAIVTMAGSGVQKRSEKTSSVLNMGEGVQIHATHL